MAAERRRAWMFTVNNPTEIMDPSGWDRISAAAWQLEMGENGTPHYQGYVTFSA